MILGRYQVVKFPGVEIFGKRSKIRRSSLEVRSNRASRSHTTLILWDYSDDQSQSMQSMRADGVLHHSYGGGSRSARRRGADEGLSESLHRSKVI